MLRLGLSKVAGAVLLQLQLLCRATSSLQKHWLEGGGFNGSVFPGFSQHGHGGLLSAKGHGGLPLCSLLSAL